MNMNMTSDAIAAQQQLDTFPRVAQLLAEMTGYVESGDWDACDSIRQHFAITVESHFNREERDLFPRFGASSAEAARVVLQLVEQHRAIRITLGRVFVAQHERRQDLEGLALLRKQLREHESFENKNLYAYLRP